MIIFFWVCILTMESKRGHGKEIMRAATPVVLASDGAPPVPVCLRTHILHIRLCGKAGRYIYICIYIYTHT